MGRLRARLSFANVVSVLALFVALGGTAGAAVLITSNGQVGPDTISGHKPPSGDHANIIGGSLGSADLGNGVVTNDKLQHDSVSNGKIAAAAVDGSKVADDSITGADVDESSLGAVPEAQALGGIGPGGFVQGAGRVVSVDAGSPTSATLVDAPGFFRLGGICSGTASLGSEAITTSSVPLTVISDNSGSGVVRHDVPASSSFGSTDWNTNPAANRITFSIEGPGGHEATADIFSYAFHNAVLNEDICHWQGYAVISGG